MIGRAFVVLRWLWLAGLGGLAGHAGAQPWDPARDIAHPGWIWAAAQQLDSSQARISVQAFQAPVPPPEAARLLAAAAGRRLTHLQWTGSLLVLSGGLEAEHWLVQLQPQAGGTAGLVSRLAPPATPAGVEFDPAALAPPGARVVLRVGGRNAAVPDSLSSYDCPGTLAQVAAAVRRALHAAGWSEIRSAEAVSRSIAAGTTSQAAAADATSLPTDWRHPRDGRLSIHAHARARSVALMFWHHPQEPS